MKEIKYYVSDDETQQSSDPEEIRKYEAKKRVIEESQFYNFVDEKGLPADILKIDKPGDINYLYNYYHIIRGDVPNDYTGYVVKQYIDDEMCSKRIITLDQYFKMLQKQISDCQSTIFEISEIIK